MKHKQASLTALCAAALLTAAPSHAENLAASPTLYGPLGLNTVPSARMDKAGTITGGLSTLDPYTNAWLGLQIASPVFINIRQTAETSSIGGDADRLYPGVDFKLRLLEETESRPAIALGVQSALGHKRMAGEYIAASKRYKDFDFTAGLGWGRYGTAKHFKNPFKGLLSHFGKNRSLDGEMPNRPDDWFTGDDIGLFAGAEYHTPLDGLSVKFDYGADRYTAEQAAFDYNAPAPWGIGLNYRTPEWSGLAGDLSLGMQGTDKVMARLFLRGNLKDWRKQDTQETSAVFMRPYRTGLALPAQMRSSAEKDGQFLYDTQGETYEACTKLILSGDLSSPRQIGRAAKHMSNHAGPAIEALNITPTIMGLRGPRVKLMRRDLMQASAKNQASAEEIWHNAEIIPQTGEAFSKLRRPAEYAYGGPEWDFTLDNQFSLAEEDNGTLYRTAAIIGSKGPTFFGLLDTAAALRLNLKDNLSKIADTRPRSILPLRSNIDRFAARRISLENQYLSFTHSLRSDLHMSLMGGYLEEMYAGAGGELLYRPYNARWAIGAQSFLALKRDPETTLNLGLNGDHILSGHIEGWYDLPKWDVTLNAKAGRFLAEDLGVSLGLQKQFKNGAKLEGFVTLSDNADFDLFGGTTHSYHGVKLSLPLGGYKYMPDNAKINTAIAPFGRDIGQSLQNPMPLYSLTEGFTLNHMSEYWDEIVE